LISQDFQTNSLDCSSTSTDIAVYFAAGDQRFTQRLLPVNLWATDSNLS